MSRTKLAVHWRPTHASNEDVAKVRKWDPRSIKIINPDYEHCRRAYEAAPNALFLLRDHPLSEQHDDMFREPTATGVRHARELAGHVEQWAPMIPREQVIVTGINEPHVWTVESLATTDGGRQTGSVTGRQVHVGGREARRLLAQASQNRAGTMMASASLYPAGIEATVRYYVAFLGALQSYGLGGGALNLSVGWPDNTGPDTPPDWLPYEPVHEAIRAGNGRHYLITHEYWSHLGPEHLWGWWAGRTLRCPWDVPIIIGECGIDEYVVGPGGSFDSRGWMSNVSKPVYLAHLAWYDAAMRADPRVHSLQIFTYDFDKPWGTFDVRPIADEIGIYANGLPELPVWEWGSGQDDGGQPTADDEPEMDDGGQSTVISPVVLDACPQEAGNYVSGNVFDVNGNPINGVRIVFSGVAPYGEWATQPQISGPHQGYSDWADGYYSHILRAATPVAADWWMWLVDADGDPISDCAYVETDGPGGTANEYVIDWVEADAMFEMLPSDEPVATPDVLADKVRWWMEELTRAMEAGNGERAYAIMYSLVRRDGGLLYRLEDTLKGLPACVFESVVG